MVKWFWCQEQVSPGLALPFEAMWAILGIQSECYVIAIAEMTPTKAVGGGAAIQLYGILIAASITSDEWNNNIGWEK